MPILDSRAYLEDLIDTHAINVPDGSFLMIAGCRLVGWARNGDVVPDGLRPHLAGNIVVKAQRT